MNRITGFEDLDVFQRAYRISLEVDTLSKRLPTIEQYGGIADQMRRASKGICANIAEGFHKQSVSSKEYLRYLVIAIGSANEMRVWLRYCYDLRYVEARDWTRMRCEYEAIAKMLSGLHRSWNK